MTSETFRSNPLFLRNQFETDGVFELPIIRRQPIDLKDVQMIGYDHVKTNDKTAAGSFVHFFLDDYKFEVLWNNPEPRVEKLSQYQGVLSPQFSTYYTMPVAQQLYNTFRSRWCGAYLQSKGLTVIPTVSWGLPQSYWYCFDGIEKGSVVAVSTLGVKREKDFFLQGYQEMLRRIEPEAVICYGSPFSEMGGKLITVDYAQTNHLTAAGKDYPDVYIKKSIGYIISAGFGGGGGGGSGGNRTGRGAGGTQNGGNFAGSGKIITSPLESLPGHVQESFKKYEKAGWKGSRSDQTPGTRGGRVYRNDSEKMQLPKTDEKGKSILYREFDVNSKKVGQGRDAERFVIGDDGSKYYTDNHYKTITKIGE